MGSHMSARTPELLLRGATGEETTYKPGDKQRRHVLRARLAYVEDGVHRESADKGGPSTNQLRAGTLEYRADHKANEEEGRYDVAYFPRHVEFMRDDW